MSCCESKPQSCCGPATNVEVRPTGGTRRLLDVELLYLDLEVCERCRGTDEIVKEAVQEAGRILGPTGIDVTLKMTHVTSEEQAKALGFVSSPTLRIMGREVAFELKESRCGGCSTLGGCDIDCRVWSWQGKDYSVPPQSMILDAILREAYTRPAGDREAPRPLEEVPENLKRFFHGTKNC